jgi:hypothetical protein
MFSYTKNTTPFWFTTNSKFEAKSPYPFGSYPKQQISDLVVLAAYPFGSVLSSFTKGAYRYGMNTQEKDNEIYGEGNSYSAEYWQYDARLARRWNVDPRDVPSFSPYSCFANNPLWFSDVAGDSAVDSKLISAPDGTSRLIGSTVTQTEDKQYLITPQNNVQKWNNEAGLYINESVLANTRNVDSKTETLFKNLGDLSMGLSLAGEGMWLLGENRSTSLYQQGFRRGLSGNYQLTGRNLSLFGNQPMTSATKPLAGLTNVGKGLSNFGTGLAVAGAVVDTYKYSQGDLSGARYGYHLTGTGASIGAAYSLGGPYGAAVGGLFFLGEKAWDMTQPMRDEISRQYWQFESALRSGWRPR